MDKESRRRRRNTVVALAVGWTVVILALCSIPGGDLPEVRIMSADKIAHFGMFAAFGWLWMLALPLLVVVAVIWKATVEASSAMNSLFLAKDGLPNGVQIPEPIREIPATVVVDEVVETISSYIEKTRVVYLKPRRKMRVRKLKQKSLN